jgi:hypothetical protein
MTFDDEGRSHVVNHTCFGFDLGMVSDGISNERSERGCMQHICCRIVICSPTPNTYI